MYANVVVRMYPRVYAYIYVCLYVREEIEMSNVSGDEICLVSA